MVYANDIDSEGSDQSFCEENFEINEKSLKERERLIEEMRQAEKKKLQKKEK